MNSPQYPGGYTPYPAYPAVVSTPSGATAITAGVLASVGAISELFGGAFSVFIGIVDFESLVGGYDTTGMFGQSWFRPWAIASGIAALVTGVLLGVGAIALFNRKRFGRLLIVVGCAATILAGIAGVVISLSADQSIGSSWNSTMLSGGTGLFSLIFPVATAILAAVPATSRWLAHVPAAGGQYAPYPPQAGQFPPQPGGYGVPPTGQQSQAAGGQNAWQQPPSGPQAWGAPVAPQAAWSQPPTGQAPWQQSPAVPQAGESQPGWPQPAQSADVAPTQVAPWQQSAVPPAVPAPTEGNGESAWKPAP